MGVRVGTAHQELPAIVCPRVAAEDELLALSLSPPNGCRKGGKEAVVHLSEAALVPAIVHHSEDICPICLAGEWASCAENVRNGRTHRDARSHHQENEEAAAVLRWLAHVQKGLADSVEEDIHPDALDAQAHPQTVGQDAHSEAEALLRPGDALAVLGYVANVQQGLSLAAAAFAVLGYVANVQQGLLVAAVLGDSANAQTGLPDVGRVDHRPHSKNWT